MKTYIARIITPRGDIVRETLGNKPIAGLETAAWRRPTAMNLRLGL
jgi:hypothetical protein